MALTGKVDSRPPARVGGRIKNEKPHRGRAKLASLRRTNEPAIQRTSPPDTARSRRGSVRRADRRIRVNWQRRAARFELDPLDSDWRSGVPANRAASSARAVALARAIEFSEPASTRPFFDPLAARFLDTGPLAIAMRCRIPVLGDAILWPAEAATPEARGHVLGRTRFIDDALRFAIDRGLDQIVILGAGHDGRPCRPPESNAVAVFEIDHPATQQRADCCELSCTRT